MLVRADFMAIEWSGLTGSCLIALTSGACQRADRSRRALQSDRKLLHAVPESPACPVQ
jgi:hypothetical protein